MIGVRFEHRCQLPLSTHSGPLVGRPVKASLVSNWGRMRDSSVFYIGSTRSTIAGALVFLAACGAVTDARPSSSCVQNRLVRVELRRIASANGEIASGHLKKADRELSVGIGELRAALRDQPGRTTTLDDTETRLGFTEPLTDSGQYRESINMKMPIFKSLLGRYEKWACK